MINWRRVVEEEAAAIGLLREIHPCSTSRRVNLTTTLCPPLLPTRANQLREGERAILHIPAELGYGAWGWLCCC
jgi:hypothetical protein